MLSGRNTMYEKIATGAQVLGMDRRLHFGLALVLSVHVDLQAGVRRVRTVYRSPQVLLLNDNQMMIYNLLIFLLFSFELKIKHSFINYVYNTKILHICIAPFNMLNLNVIKIRFHSLQIYKSV